MKTFIVYDLDTGLPIAVGEAIKAEWARVETAEETNIRRVTAAFSNQTRGAGWR